MAQARWSLLGWCGRTRVGLVVVAALALASMTGGCYGHFPLTRTIYDVNGAVPLGILRTVVFWVFAVTAYPVAMLVDALALNLVEFWTGVHAPAASITDENGTTYAMETSPDGREMVVTISRDGQASGTLRFVRVSDAELELWDADGALAGRMLRDAGGSIRLTDAQGTTMDVIDAQQAALLGAVHVR